MFYNKERIPAVFVIPIIGDQIYLAKRKKEPYSKYYGPIGGKIEKKDSLRAQSIFFNKQDILFNGNVATKEQVLQDGGYENLLHAAVREFCEEIFSDKIFPEDFSKGDFSQFLDLGMIIDKFAVPGKEVWCHFYTCKINRNDFNLSKEELFEPLTPLYDIKENDIFPVGIISLNYLKFLTGPIQKYFYRDKDIIPYEFLFDQIPEFKTVQRNYETFMNGAFDYNFQIKSGKSPQEAFKYMGLR